MTLYLVVVPFSGLGEEYEATALDELSDGDWGECSKYHVVKADTEQSAIYLVMKARNSYG